MLLDILIPTYNREKALEKNIHLLINYIDKLDLHNEVQIIVSDNCSTDGTSEMINEIKKTSAVSIILFTHESNIGLEKNAVFTLSKSQSEYVMYLGDDDFLQFEYLEKVVEILKHKKYSCIIPSFLAKTVDNRITGHRSLGESKTYKKGFDAAYNLSMLGHQLSGVTFLREGTLEHYLKNENLRNIYLFISFVGFNCLRGGALHLTEYPVEVTVGEKKDWNYGEDALFNEKIKNVPLIYNRGFNRFKLENKFFLTNIYSIFTIYPTMYDRVKALYLSSFSKNLSLVFKVYIPFLLLLFVSNKICEKLFKKLGDDR